MHRAAIGFPILKGLTFVSESVDAFPKKVDFFPV